jgi:hypothetical protein
MPTYKLRLHFNQNDLRVLISNGYSVAIAKYLEDPFNPSVAWLAFRPRADNVVTWEEEYGIYSSQTTIEPGARIEIRSTTGVPASRGKVYVLNSSGKFDPPQDGGPGAPADMYLVRNEYDNPGHPLAFGLYQSANVDGAPLDRNVASVVRAPYPFFARLTASPSLFLMVLRGESGTVLRNDLPGRTLARFGSDTEASFTFNLNEGYFEPSGGRPKEDASTGAAAGGLVVEHFPPEPA